MGVLEKLNRRVRNRKPFELNISDNFGVVVANNHCSAVFCRDPLVLFPLDSWLMYSPIHLIRGSLRSGMTWYEGNTLVVPILNVDTGLVFKYEIADFEGEFGKEHMDTACRHIEEMSYFGLRNWLLKTVPNREPFDAVLNDFLEEDADRLERLHSDANSHKTRFYDRLFPRFRGDFDRYFLRGVAWSCIERGSSQLEDALRKDTPVIREHVGGEMPSDMIQLAMTYRNWASAARRHVARIFDVLGLLESRLYGCRKVAPVRETKDKILDAYFPELAE